MTLVKYKVFLKVVETGSFTKAANELNMTQSAVSHAISSLEHDMMFKLFSRNKGKVELTNDGQTIFAQVTSLILAERKLINEINALNNLDSGLIRFGSFSSASSRLLAPIIKVFEKKYPNVKIELIEGNYPDIQNWVNSGSVDVAFLVDNYLDKGHYAIPFFKDEMLVLVPKDYDISSDDCFDINQLDQYPFILSIPDNVVNRYLNSIFSEYKTYPAVKYKTTLNSTVFSMVEQGLGISIAAESSLFKSKYNFVTMPMKTPIFRQIYLTTSTAEVESPIIKAFFEVAEGIEII